MDRTTHRIYPRIQTGDRLWVREAHCFDLNHWINGSRFVSSDKPFVLYRASEAAQKAEDDVPFGIRWRPSIHMPRWASRINLLVKDILVERVQDISVEDVLEEGTPDTGKYDYDPVDETRWRCEFSDLWDSINAKRGFGWDTNPWVWVIEFERITTND